MSLKDKMEKILKKESDFGGSFSTGPSISRKVNDQSQNNSFDRAPSAPSISRRVDDQQQNNSFDRAPYISRTVDENEQKDQNGNYISTRTTWGKNQSEIMKKMSQLIKQYNKK
jgi:hypothetical protein